jgi:hypothetical protein
MASAGIPWAVDASGQPVHGGCSGLKSHGLALWQVPRRMAGEVQGARPVGAGAQGTGTRRKEPGFGAPTPDFLLHLSIRSTSFGSLTVILGLGSERGL